MAAKREIKTPGVTAEQNQEEQKVVAPEPEQDTSTKDQAEAALSEILSGPQDSEGPTQTDIPDWASAIVENQARIEQKLDAILSQSNAGSVPKPKGRFKLVDGKGHVWVEG
ncbi:hypothetical protein ACMATZ_000751 [Acinetobacter baumannii]|uniref:hypothetical protein n=1 Tax=Acinetobacter baumannii TaxID=470 RepID=UPI001127DC51|nr:hypothetical protein [Acinetobacter baumannii]EHU2109398.1 hypothetical protein [Acinetobacter baumannii]EHU2113296.1 hypothetical protein [Acinetobacter baumannii]EHZ6771491.1 hypothetical protein [Acinetobacter baumannii]EHZ6775294.1 hypothetical protein [Acinetobacter baumannii]EKU1422575.1 hypothetical protein [Acinetobacter baumannii]